MLAKNRNLAVYLPTDFLNIRIFSLSVNIEKKESLKDISNILARATSGQDKRNTTS